MPEEAFSLGVGIFVGIEGVACVKYFTFKVDLNLVDGVLIDTCEVGERRRVFSKPIKNQIPSGHPLFTEFIRLKKEFSEIRKEVLGLVNDISNLAQGCKTDVELLSRWPEAKKWLPRKPAIDAANVLAEKLNKKLCDLIGPASPTCSEEQKQLLDGVIEAEFSQVKE